MKPEQFRVMMPEISADLVRTIVSKRSVSEQDAMQLLYNSQLYADLEEEETKLWQYSTPMLYTLLEQEWNTGTIRFPDV